MGNIQIYKYTYRRQIGIGRSLTGEDTHFQLPFFKWSPKERYWYLYLISYRKQDMGDTDHDTSDDTERYPTRMIAGRMTACT